MPSLPNNEQSSNPHLAALVAINIVTQVLDDAQDIVNTANDSGQPWRYIWNLRKGNGEFYKNSEILGIVNIKGYGKDDDYEINQEDNVIVTTPPKEFGVTKNYNDAFIGQGDEDMQTRNTDLRSSSMVINCLFDLGELEQATKFEIADDVPIDSEPDLLSITATELVESYINLALNIVCGEVCIPEKELIAESIQESIHSSYSFLSDASVSVFTENVLDIKDDVKHDEEENMPSDCQVIKNLDNHEDIEEIKNKDIDLYEKTFCTLNRDYEKFSEEEDSNEDQKNMIMQEVELPTNILLSSENIAVNAELGQTIKEFEKPATVSVVADTHKHSLVKRCRIQGARLMNRLRTWWWKQRLIGKRKLSGLIPGMCPLSPKVLNRASSLLDNRKIRSPSPLGVIGWKFNTVNEALIHSYGTKEFEMNSSNPEEEY